jgi:hypothetical protein
VLLLNKNLKEVQSLLVALEEKEEVVVSLKKLKSLAFKGKIHHYRKESHIKESKKSSKFQMAKYHKTLSINKL